MQKLVVKLSSVLLHAVSRTEGTISRSSDLSLHTPVTRTAEYQKEASHGCFEKSEANSWIAGNEQAGVK